MPIHKKLLPGLFDRKKPKPASTSPLERVLNEKGMPREGLAREVTPPPVNGTRPLESFTGENAFAHTAPPGVSITPPVFGPEPVPAFPFLSRGFVAEARDIVTRPTLTPTHKDERLRDLTMRHQDSFAPTFFNSLSDDRDWLPFAEHITAQAEATVPQPGGSLFDTDAPDFTLPAAGPGDPAALISGAREIAGMPSFTPALRRQKMQQLVDRQRGLMPDDSYLRLTEQPAWGNARLDDLATLATSPDYAGQDPAKLGRGWATGMPVYQPDGTLNNPDLSYDGNPWADGARSGWSSLKGHAKNAAAAGLDITGKPPWVNNWPSAELRQSARADHARARSLFRPDYKYNPNAGLAFNLADTAVQQGVPVVTGGLAGGAVRGGLAAARLAGAGGKPVAQGIGAGSALATQRLAQAAPGVAADTGQLYGELLDAGVHPETAAAHALAGAGLVSIVPETPGQKFSTGNRIVDELMKAGSAELAKQAYRYELGTGSNY